MTMKRSILLCLTLLVAAGALAQTTLIVNNNPGATPGVNVYTGATALQNAINAAASGDIIHIVPGTVSNGHVTITDKSLTIMGVGLNPQKGLGTRSLAGDITVNGAASSGTRISGVHFLRFLPALDPTPVHTVSNLLIENCQFNCVQMLFNGNAVGNLIVRNCVINSHQGFTSGPQAIEVFISSGVLITNNIIRAQGNNAGTIKGNGLTIQNNLFYGGGTFNVFIDLDNSIVQNNIFARTSPALNTTNSTGNTFANNIVFGSTDNTFTNGVAGNTSTGHIIADPLLTNVPSSTSDWVYTYDINLLAGSPAINAGLDGKNLGPTGGITGFDPEGTLLPLIESINMAAIVTKGVDMQVNVKAKGN
jgi:hypothetical protein